MISRRFLQVGLVVAMVFVTGCADYLTFSKDSRRKGLEALRLGQYDEAQGAFADAVRQNPLDYQSFYQLGVLYQREKNYQMALSSYKKSLAVQRESSDGRMDVESKYQTLDAYARCLALADDRDSEINDIEKEATQSNKGDDYLVLARAYYYKKDADSALGAYARAAHAAPESFLIAKEYSLYLERLGLGAQAKTELIRAYRLNPEDTDINMALRRQGVIPGPGLKTEEELARPLVPVGPIPTIKWPWSNSSPTPAIAPTPPGSPSGPRD